MNFKQKLLDLIYQQNQKRKDKEKPLDYNNQNKWILKREKEQNKNHIRKELLRERKLKYHKKEKNKAKIKNLNMKKLKKMYLKKKQDYNCQKKKLILNILFMIMMMDLMLLNIKLKNHVKLLLMLN